MKKNSGFIIFISVVIGILLIFGSVVILHNYNDSKANELKESYVVIKEVYNDSIVVSDSNTKNTKTYLTNGGNFRKGDLIVIKTKGDRVEDYDVIVEDYVALTSSIIVVDNDETTTTTTSEATTTNNNSSNNNTTTTTTKRNNVTTTVRTTTIVKTTTKTVTVDKDEEVLKYVTEEYNTVNNGDKSQTFKEKAKKIFTTLVDFIFYDGKIKDVTFKDLKASTKAKVIYYTLLIDAKIDKEFPNYKEGISSKYKDVKSKLLASYLDIKYDVCQKSGDDCEIINNDFRILKFSLNLTWDIIKGCFTYIKNLTVPKIQSWYESFRG